MYQTNDALSQLLDDDRPMKIAMTTRSLLMNNKTTATDSTNGGTQCIRPIAEPIESGGLYYSNK